jgi:hypothetical protein
LAKESVKPAAIEAVNGIPNHEISPDSVILPNEEDKLVRTNVKESSSIPWSTEIICYCCRYNNKPITAYLKKLNVDRLVEILTF